MSSKELISFISTIQRALGMIEGVSYGLAGEQAACLVDAVQMIDEAMENIQINSKSSAGNDSF